MANFNMQPKKHPMPTQPAEERSRNFKEVALGYDEAVAIDEAKRCLNCKTRPCVSGCPVEIAIPEFISFVVADFPFQFSSGGLRQSLPAGNAVRREMHARNQSGVRSGGDRQSRTFRGRLS